MILLYIAALLGFFYVLGLLIAALIKPRRKLFIKRFGEGVTRGKLALGLVPLLLATLVVATLTTPDSLKNAQTSAQKSTTATQQTSLDTKPAEPQPRIEEKTITETQPVPYSSQTREDGSLAKGQTRITQVGKNGEKALTYNVTLTDGKETARQLTKEEVIIQPMTEVTLVGTYVAPSSGSGYTNSDDNHVASPSSDPVGATAKCGDGTYSYSQHRSGTCSHHGGVAIWY